MIQIAFYLMSEKGFYILKHFIQKFDASFIRYVVGHSDKNMQNDYYVEIKMLCKKNRILFLENHDEIQKNEKNFSGYKFSISWRWMILDYHKLIVFHDSLLPKYRGFAPLVNALVSGDKEIGVSALFATEEYDKGDIIAQKKVNINYPIKIQDAIESIQPLYFEILCDIYQSLLDNEPLSSYAQDENRATYSLWLDNQDYLIDWENWSAQKIERFVNAVEYPFDNAKSYLNGVLLKIYAVKEVQDVVVENRMRHIGKVIFMDNTRPVVVCKEGLLRLEKVKNLKNEDFKITFRSRFN